MIHETVVLRPWQVPNFASVDMLPGKREDGLRDRPTIAVADLSQAALDGLAHQWLADLYQKAGKPNKWVTISP